MSSTIADLIVETLKSAGVRRVYGLPGDSLNGFTDALRRDGSVSWQHVRHEEAAAFAAAGEAAVTGELAVCAGSCGPGNLHLINGLFDANRSRVPVLAIAAHIPSAEIGGSYFQETHPQELFRECSVYCELASTPAQFPYVLDIAVRTAVERRGVAVLVVPGDVLPRIREGCAADRRDPLEQPGRSARRRASGRGGGRAEPGRTGDDPRRSRLRGRPRRGRRRSRRRCRRRSCMRCAARSSSSTTTPTTSA